MVQLEQNPRDTGQIQGGPLHRSSSEGSSVWDEGGDWRSKGRLFACLLLKAAGRKQYSDGWLRVCSRSSHGHPPGRLCQGSEERESLVRGSLPSLASGTRHICTGWRPRRARRAEEVSN